MPNHWRSVTSVGLALLGLVYADASCYYAAHARATPFIIPCSSASGFSTCCQLGDLCLSNNACWNPTYNTTYLYGCTDPSFTDNTCPYKCGPTYATSPWVVIGYCFDSGAARQWTCKHPPNNITLIGPVTPDDSPPVCDNVSLIAFAGSNQLQPIISLPTSTGGPTATFVSTAGSYSPTILSPTPVPSSKSARANNNLGLGLGIGLGVGITLIAVVLGVIWLQGQQRRKRAAAAPAYSGELLEE